MLAIINFRILLQDKNCSDNYLMHTTKRTLIIISLIAFVSVSFVNKRTVKFNRLMVQMNQFFLGLEGETGFLDLKRISSQTDKIELLKNSLSVVSLQKANESAQKMFYINAFNLRMIDLINQKQQGSNLELITDIYDGDSFTVSKGQFTLRSLKHYLMVKYKDPKVLFAIYWGGNYAPQLSAPPKKNYEKYLTQKMVRFLNDDGKVRVKEKSHKLVLPEFMKWCISDFGFEDPQQFIPFINTVKQGNKVPSDYEVLFYPHSWKLD